ncbi:patatin-like phospholipase family protein [Adhaeribacter rhizoryzae]|uniref:Patatin-like phospholipase family protein n=1 Tax=Adhaeribacter rhizoryzae TaxID=2607907 RepID=A0A5M6D7P4_9BACT|nr:patatin-like phospholipase family protein [Adhaeribacter rhizoryzae]KAA5541195.1 patatin-like phospholipase family protein [Adhaeribacter rhizoryzae]
MENIPKPLPFRVPEGYQGPKRSLVLAGGGMRLSYQAGVLKALEEHGLQFTHADGTSGGIFTLAMLLSGLSTDQMCHNWRTLNSKHFVSYLPFRKYLNPLRLAAFGDADGIRYKILPHLGVNIERIQAEQALAGTFNVCNYSEKKNEAIPHQNITLPHLLAGVSLPMFMPALKINHNWYIDAVWIKDANLLEAVRRGAEEIWVVWTIGNISEYKNGTFNQYVQMIEMSANGALYAELDYITELNHRISRGDSPYGQQKTIQVHLIKPAYPLPLDPDLYFNRVNATTLIDRGYADAKEYLLNLPPEPVATTNLSTKMKSQGIAFSCRAKLSGKLFNQLAVLHLSLTIHDIQDYVQTNQPYQLNASLSFPEGLRIYYGFNGELTVQRNDTGQDKLVQFQFRAEMEGKSYVVTGSAVFNGRFLSGSGKKAEVKLYAGTSPVGRPLQTAEFNISVADWVYLRRSLSVYNANGWFERRRAKKTLKSYFFSDN